MNPVTIAMWIFAALVGYLIGDWRGAVIGAAIAVGLSLAVSLHSISKRGW